MLVRRCASSDLYRSCIHLIMSKKRPLPTITLHAQLDLTPCFGEKNWNPSLPLAGARLQMGRSSKRLKVGDGVSGCLSHDVGSAVVSTNPLALEHASIEYSVIVKKLVDSGQFELAYDVYFSNFIAREVQLDLSTLNSMVVCLSKLGKCEEARLLFDNSVASGFFPSKTACETYILTLCSREMFLEAFDSFDRINPSKQQYSARFYNILIKGLCTSGFPENGRRVFDILLERSGFSPTLHMFKSLYYAFCKKNMVFEAEIIFVEMEEYGFFVDKVMYTALINVFCKMRRVDSAMRIYLRMIKMGCKPDGYTIRTLMHGFCALGLFGRAWDLCNKLNEIIYDGHVAYHVMMTRYCKEGKLDCAKALFSSMNRRNVKPGVYHYTTMISALSKDSRQQDIELLFRQMLSSGVVPDDVLFLIFLRSIPKGHELELCLLMLRLIARDGTISLPCEHPLVPQTVEQEIEFLLEQLEQIDINLANLGYSIYIAALCKEWKLDAGLSWLKRLVDFGFKPLLFAYNSVINCLCCNDLFDDAHALIEAMQEQNIVPDSATYLLRIKEHCRRRDSEAAITLFREMKNRGMNPAVNIYDLIIGCLCKEGRICKAEAMFKEMIHANVEPDEKIYRTLMNGYFMNRNAEDGQLLFETMVENSISPSSHSYTVLITGLINCNMAYSACVYAHKMLMSGFDSNLTLCTSLILHFLRKNEIELAFRLIETIDLNKCDSIFFSALITAICRLITHAKNKKYVVNIAGDKAKEKLLWLLHDKSNLSGRTTYSLHEMQLFVLKLLQKIKEANFAPELTLYNAVIQGFCCVNQLDDAYDQCQLMLKDGIHPNPVTFTILLNAHVRMGETKHAIMLFNNMFFYGCVPDGIMHISLLNALCKEGKGLDVLCLLYTMLKRGFPPSKVTYHKVLHCLCAGGYGMAALRVLEEMLRHGFLPRLFLIKQLLSLFVEENMHQANALFDNILSNGHIDAHFK